MKVHKDEEWTSSTANLSAQLFYPSFTCSRKEKGLVSSIALECQIQTIFILSWLKGQSHEALFQLSSQNSEHDELDFEFLGNRTGQPYILRTNVFSGGKGDME